MIGCAAHIFARLLFGLADTSLWFYVGGAVSTIGPIATPMLKAMISKLAEPNERGKVFVIFSMFNNAGSFVGGIMYARVYAISVGTAWIFWMTAGTQLLVFVLIM